MTLQIIKSIDGKAEYVLLPVNIYHTLRQEIEEALRKRYSSDDYVPFELTDYVDNPVALARINAGITQETLAKRMCVTQAYISKLEAQSKVTVKVLKKVQAAIEHNKK
ncbi:MAG: transcriptional regulator [Gammaproteobacteria bacterium RIFCSPHIGHO2_12_FULL_37_14]|nr:MAG: transcriptional regulator [Gammaproteobacteria bacterium RIFCSPHIGHO2_12_FULL_37_14]